MKRTVPGFNRDHAFAKGTWDLACVTCVRIPSPTQPHSEHSNQHCYLFGGFLLILQVSGLNHSSTCGGTYRWFITRLQPWSVKAPQLPPSRARYYAPSLINSRNRGAAPPCSSQIPCFSILEHVWDTYCMQEHVGYLRFLSP